MRERKKEKEKRRNKCVYIERNESRERGASETEHTRA